MSGTSDTYLTTNRFSGKARDRFMLTDYEIMTASASDNLLMVTVNGAIGRITINRPKKRNALTLDMWQALPEHVTSLVQNPDVRTIILSGAGNEAFSAGADISEFEATRATAEAVAIYDAANEAAFGAFRNADKPTIAEISGFCMGGGLGLALACDFRIAAPDAKFAIPAAKLGIGYSVPWLADLLRAVLASTAKDILFSARSILAEEAHATGLIDTIADPVQEESEAFARRMAENAPLTIIAAKRAINALMSPDIDRVTAELQPLIEACFKSDDYAEGRRAFREKRKPDFKGR